ncbi:GNAT family N-acetyltransferase [Clostridium sp. C2-6-12]|uniref:GNAT family N-acetyltransferase n=1 Tax=Clostridium sp. C2-6-12 TaxID=2698832 RepID=UPI00137187C8|nr:GNAT family N-acetyltransferase [Clostridium sp. C2-6-12]
MDYLIKKVNYEELDKAFSLIWSTFSEFISPNYSKEGVNTFRINFIESKDFKECFKNGTQIMYGAYSKEKLVGIISLSRNNNVSCLFVNKEYHRKGIASMLFRHIISLLKERQVEKITLNASPHAVPFYHAMGFKDLNIQQDFNGILYTPMEFQL